ncbi:MAG: aminotransferase class I/II-fold pyridoxal phosphate-dependent enzyme [Candidatus Omnitrophota bacterium]|nr:MAG: aminotransferase class I/II-fold pyridoxal phosphate-dependent enzyme [Candidatus Omnitrophota bacterium]
MGILSKITDLLLGQPMFNLLQKAQKMEISGRRIIHYEIGDPSFDSPPHAIEAAKEALDANLTHYTSSMGLFEYREAIREYTKANSGFKPSIDQVLACPANAVIDFVIRCTANPGEEVIYPDPGFPTYYSAITYNKAIPVGILLKEENMFRMSPRDVHDKITDKTRLIIINSPQNPTGAVLKEEEILEFARIAEEHDIYLLSDEVYAKLTYDKAHYSPSVRDQCKARTIILNSLSKQYSMAGWRLGYAIGPEKLIEKMGLLLQTIISCLPAFTQLGGRAALLGNQEFMDARIAMLRERRDILTEGLNKLPGVSCVVPDGAFYVFANISKTGITSEEYSEKLLQETGVCVLAGNYFGKGGSGYIRLCYASSPISLIEETLEKMKEFHEKIVCNSGLVCSGGENAKTY